MSKEICGGSSPWKCTPEELKASLELARIGLLPVGKDAGVDVISLLNLITTGELTPDEIRASYQVNENR